MLNAILLEQYPQTTSWQFLLQHRLQLQCLASQTHADPGQQQDTSPQHLQLPPQTRSLPTGGLEVRRSVRAGQESRDAGGTWVRQPDTLDTVSSTSSHSSSCSPLCYSRQSSHVPE